MAWSHGTHVTGQTALSVYVWAVSGTQAKGKPRDTWQSTVYKDLSTLHVQYNWFRLAYD